MTGQCQNKQPNISSLERRRKSQQEKRSNSLGMPKSDDDRVGQVVRRKTTRNAISASSSGMQKKGKEKTMLDRWKLNQNKQWIHCCNFLPEMSRRRNLGLISGHKSPPPPNVSLGAPPKHISMPSTVSVFFLLRCRCKGPAGTTGGLASSSFS